MFIKLLKIILPITFLSISLTAFASIESPKYEGTCNPKSVTLSGNGSGEINVDNSRVNDANGNWSVDLPLKVGSHNVKVGIDSLDFSIPKCPEGGGVINPSSCLGLFGKFAQNCKVATQGTRFIPAGIGECPVWMSGGCIANEPIVQDKSEQKLIESLQAQISELTAQIVKLLALRK